MNPITALITGLTTGGLTCFAVQGGLLLGILGKRDEEGKREKRNWGMLILPVAAFLIAKAIAYTLVGFGLGSLGNVMQISSTVRLSLQAVAGFVIVASGIRLAFPGFLPWLAITPPAAVRRFVRRSSRAEMLFAPAILGFLTILIPCGTTQAMGLAAVASGSGMTGALIMLAFTLGTAPLFFAVGILAKGTSFFQGKFSYVAALLVIGLGVYTLNGVLVSTGSPYAFQNIVSSARLQLSGDSGESADSSDAPTASPVITVTGGGYSPDVVTVPSGQLVELTLKGKGQLGCTSTFRIPKLGIETNVLPNASTTVAATFPQPGRYTFSCGMGMYTGTFIAV